MTGISSVPVGAGVPFAVLNPRMDQQRPHEQPAAVPVYVVGNLRYLTEGEAVRAAQCSAELGGKPADILVGSFHMDGLQHVRTITPVEGETARAARWAKLGIDADNDDAEAESSVESITVGETLTAAQACNALGITADSFEAKPTISGQTVMDAVNGIVETVPVKAVPMKDCDKPQTWHSPAIHPEKELQVFPTEGLFTPEEWAAILGCSPTTVERNLHTFGVGLTDGKISAAEWWETLSNADTKMPPAKKTFWRTQRTFGIVTVSVENWKPKNARAVPPSLTDGLGMWLSSRYAMLFNSSPVAVHRSHWACTTVRGTIIVLSGVRLQDRPVDVSDFPRCVQGGLTFHEAEQMTEAANTPRMEFSRVPKEWCVAVRMANTVEAEVMGGDA